MGQIYDVFFSKFFFWNNFLRVSDKNQLVPPCNPSTNSKNGYFEEKSIKFWPKCSKSIKVLPRLGNSLTGPKNNQQ